MGIIIQQTAAGGLVMRANEFGYQVLLALVRRDEPNDWSLPKGRIEEGESRQQAAQRIVKEQTGVDTTVTASLGPVDYSYTIFLPVEEQDAEGHTVGHDSDIQQAMQSYHKVVYFYLMRASGGTLGEGEDAVAEVQWFTIPEAQELLTHEGDLTTLARAVDLITRTSPHGQIIIGSGIIGNPQGNVNPETAQATTVRSKLQVLSFEL
jgi:ADP-ribose pyrophosphatase YjhB (NUDIX family)